MKACTHVCCTSAPVLEQIALHACVKCGGCTNSLISDTGEDDAFMQDVCERVCERKQKTRAEKQLHVPVSMHVLMCVCVCVFLTSICVGKL